MSWTRAFFVEESLSVVFGMRHTCHAAPLVSVRSVSKAGLQRSVEGMVKANVEYEVKLLEADVRSWGEL